MYESECHLHSEQQFSIRLATHLELLRRRPTQTSDPAGTLARIDIWVSTEGPADQRRKIRAEILTILRCCMKEQLNIYDVASENEDDTISILFLDSEEQEASKLLNTILQESQKKAEEQFRTIASISFYLATLGLKMSEIFCMSAESTLAATKLRLTPWENEQ